MVFQLILNCFMNNCNIKVKMSMELLIWAHCLCKRVQLKLSWNFINLDNFIKSQDFYQNQGNKSSCREGVLPLYWFYLGGQMRCLKKENSPRNSICKFWWTTFQPKLNEFQKLPRLRKSIPFQGSSLMLLQLWQKSIPWN